MNIIKIGKSIFVLSALIASCTVQADSSCCKTDKGCDIVAPTGCGQGDTLTIGIFGDPNGVGNPYDFVVNGQPRGFDIALYCQIAARLGKNIIFKQVASVADGLGQVQASTLDMFGGSQLVINQQRLNDFGFVVVNIGDPATNGCLGLIFATGTLPVTLEPATTVLSRLAAIPGIFIGGNRPGSIQNITLERAGFSPSRIVNLGDVLPRTADQIVAALSGNNPARVPLAAIYLFTADITQDIVSNSNGRLDSVRPCVPLAPDVAVQGLGIAFNKKCCQLMLQVQAVFNQIVEDGTYANLVQAQRNDPNNQANPLILSGIGKTDLVPPAIPNDSILKGFIPANCGGVPNIPANPLVSFILSKYCLTGCNVPYIPVTSVPRT